MESRRERRACRTLSRMSQTCSSRYRSVEALPREAAVAEGIRASGCPSAASNGVGPGELFSTALTTSGARNRVRYGRVPASEARVGIIDLDQANGTSSEYSRTRTAARISS